MKNWGLGVGDWGLGASNCREWEERIAGELDDPAVAAHVAECEGCRAFVSGLRDALSELKTAHAEEIAPAHYAAVRARVMAELRPRRRWGWAWACAAAAVVAGFGMRAVTERMRVEELGLMVTSPEIPAADLRARGMPARMAAWRAKSSLHEKEEIVMKIETGNPDVVIYWLAEAKGDER